MGLWAPEALSHVADAMTASLAAGPDLQDRVEPACFSKAFVRAGLVAVTLVGLVTRSRWATAQPPDGRPFQGQGPTLLASHPRRSGAAEGGGRWSAPSPGAASAAATPGLCSATALVGLGGSLTMSSQRPATLPVPRQTGTISLATLAVMAMMGVPLISLLRAQGLVGQRWSAPQPRVYAAPDAARDAQAQAGEEGPLASGAESGESVVNEPAVSAALAASLGAATSQPSPAAAEVAPLQTGVENPLGPKEWGPTQPSAYDPLHGLADWSAPTVWSKYDPLVRAIRSTARPGSSKYDPLDVRSRAPRSQPAFFAASAAGPDKYDAVGCMLAAAAASFGGRTTSTQGPQRYDAAGQLLRASLQHTLPEARSVRYDPIDWLRSGWAGGPEVPAAPQGAARYDPVSGLGSVTAPRHATKYDPARELLSGDWLDAATRGFDAAASRLGLIPEAATNEGRASMEGPAEDLDGVARDAADPSIWSPKTPALSSL
ncbi:hypothetical protein APUTEX25_000599 [Auxenochlorella protothecoides]|uniref:Uncharacterized protein n=1 Tax=Auxenochlorella protothecoides TaxID=3075 RepID=A0A3M7KUN5_AUXPR|nr:hypothetical protein APUTEX25_000599 [Auxenochlorella protothecoides]|eukprot:RMZ54248.1 hypothetical protein APUTEX25_000599 [Auxenochlorella protothecoides]